MRPRFGLLAVVALLPGCGGGGREALSLPRAPAVLRVSSPAFADGARLPRRYTCDGAGAEPPVRVAGAPAGTRALVLVVSDPDAPGGTFVHLTRYGGVEGRNSAGKNGWTPPCPPKGGGAHRYVWSVYALGDRPALRAGATPGQVAAALDRGVLAGGTITARYAR